MTIEHRLLRSDKPKLAGDYENCFYACRLCNGARGIKALQTENAQLLDPTKDPWGQHFELSGSSLKPKPGDADAQYTFEAYDLDDERKRSRRLARKELIEDRMQLLAHIGDELVLLLDLAEQIRSTMPEAFLEVWGAISDLRQQAHRAESDLELYRAIPSDRPKICRCSPPGDFTLPNDLAEQCLTISR